MSLSMVMREVVERAEADLSTFAGAPDHLEASDLELPVIDAVAAAKLIDHTLLQPDATVDQVRALCSEAREYGFATVCVNGFWVALCSELLAGSSVAVCAVVGFPLGATLSRVKAFEAAEVARAGAGEVDMVLNIGALQSGLYEGVAADILAVVEAAREHDAQVKVIVETCLLSDTEKAIACRLAVDAGAAFVKTSTGFSTAGATVHDVALMRHVVGERAGVKASGGVRTGDDLRRMVGAGATRIGARAGVAIIESLRAGE